MAAPPSSDARPDMALSSDPSPSPPPEPLLIAPPPNPYPPPTRDHSTVRGRAPSITSPRNASPRGITPTSTSRPKQSFDMERRPSLSYGHHRQTSIVHGVQHSRNPSLLASASASPLSPQKILATGAAETASITSASSSYNATPTNLSKNSSVSVLHSSPASSTSGPANRPFDHATPAPQRRPERMHSGRVKRSHEHQRSQSRAQAQLQPSTQMEVKTVGEYALHHLLTSFIAEADERIERCMQKPGEPEPRVEGICGPGADPAFDQLIWSLGHINRHKPKSLIDSVIHWRKMKADAANLIYNESRASRETASSAQQRGNAFAASYSAPSEQVLAQAEHDVAVADRRSTVSIYILCRVLIEIIGQTTLKALYSHESGTHTADTLEEVIYGQLQSVDPDMLAASSVIRANWVIRGQLLGVMSDLRFEEVTARFIRDLEPAQKRLSIKGSSEIRLASKTVLLVQSMRWLNFRTRPEDAWSRTCETLHMLARFFAEVHGRPMKHAYAELFEQLLIPIAATADAQLNAPRWKEIVSILQPKIAQMLPKADHWPIVYPLQAILLCASPLETFTMQWMSLVTSFQPKARDRPGRSHALKAICRLVWRYLYRCQEGQTAVARKLDEIIKLVFQGGRKMLISTDPAIADPLIQLIRIIGYKHYDLCFRAIIFPLMHSDLISDTEKELKIETLDPERTVIAIRAFLAVMTDLESGTPPSFPVRFDCDALLNPAARAPIVHRRTRSQGFAVSTERKERFSRPVMVTKLDDAAREWYVRFCKILGQLTIICDNTFGGQAVLDEKFATHSTPKTPNVADMFSKREDPMSSMDLRQHYYDLLHVAVEALPRCLSPHLPINSLVNLLCTGTAHVQSHIAASSAQSLKSIARQSHAQQVTIGFARFIFNFDDRYATVSDGSLLGPGHIENTLTLYVELLQIWIDEIQQRTHKAAAAEPGDHDETLVRPLPPDLMGILAHVDEVESHGLFFLCSSSRAVRAIAVSVLRLITKFDTALGKPCNRIISILEGGSQQVIDVNDERLSLAERSRLQRGLRKSNVNNSLVELCSSDVAHDANLWFKVFPNLVRLSAEICMQAVALTRELVCQRLSHSYRVIGALAEGPKQASNPIEQAFASNRSPIRLNNSAPEVVVEQWKIHLIFACTTLTNIGGSQQQHHAAPVAAQGPQHARKSSKSSANGQEKIASATELFSKVVPFLAVSNNAVRAAAVAGLGATNATLFDALLEALRPFVSMCSSEAKERLTSHQRSTSNPRRFQRMDYLRTEITHLLSLTCRLLQDPAIANQHSVIEYMGNYTKDLRLFLSDSEIQGELELQRLRTHFCTLLEGLYESIRKMPDGARYMSFQARQANFALMENWVGFSPNDAQIRRQQDQIRTSMLENMGNQFRNRTVVNSAMEKEKNELQQAALSAMAALCAGPLKFTNEQNVVIMQFDVRRILFWIDAIFEAPSDRSHAIGKKALQNIIVHNLDQPFLMAQTFRKCYNARPPKALSSYFEVVTKVLTENPDMDVPFWKILCAGLYTLGNEDSGIRMKSARLLRTLEERQGKTSRLQDLDISVTDKTTAVYKLAQFEISRRLAHQHPELAFHVFSEFSAYFNELLPDHQRNMVSAMLPWIQAIELQLDATGAPTATSYMLLVNLFEITVKISITLHNEIQALWQALATGPYAGNVQLVLDFIITTCLEKKEQNFVIYAKQIVVFLSKTPAGARVIEYLLMQISPKNMVVSPRESALPPLDAAGLPYVADLAVILPAGAKQSALSLGQLSMILLVDLAVSPFQLPADKVPVLLQVILVQWDQYAPIVQDQARELLVHLIHELVISKIEPGSTEPDKESIEDFIETVRRHDSKISWTYGDSETRTSDEHSRTVSEPMAYVIDELVRIFSITYPDIREDWGRVTLNWATSCAVRHVACRSFQVFRCVSTGVLEPQMLADMLARLSNTIADDDNHDYLVFSLEILMTLRIIISALDPLDLLNHFPLLFWTTCACLDTIFEREFQEGLGMLAALLNKLNLSDPAVLKILAEKQPPNWVGGFQGLQALVCKGVRSSQLLDRTLSILERLVKVQSSEIVGSDDRLLFTLLADLPRYAHYLQNSDDLEASACLSSAETLAFVAKSQEHEALSELLSGFAHGRHRSAKNLLEAIVREIQVIFFPALEFESLVFLLGMVNNQRAWYKVQTMKILCLIIPEIDMRKPEIASQGPDLISPLLRLLQTEHCQQALDVLDNVIDMTGTPLDQKHLRMSMAGSHSSRATRKEYDWIKSLYGIPEESGWSIPMPAKHSDQTRQNIHAVFHVLAYGAAGPPLQGAMPPATPEIEFHKDDFGSFDSGLFNGSVGEGRTATMLSDDTRLGETSFGEIAEKLDSLDDFFDDLNDPPPPINHYQHYQPQRYHHPYPSNGSGSSSSFTGRAKLNTGATTDIIPNPFTSSSSSSLSSSIIPTGLPEERETLYDQQALPILHRSLKRNASISSFQTGLAEFRPPTSVPAPAMNPTAFAKSVHKSSASLTRPGLHSRSVTSPVMSVTASPTSTGTARRRPSSRDQRGLALAAAAAAAQQDRDLEYPASLSGDDTASEIGVSESLSDDEVLTHTSRDLRLYSPRHHYPHTFNPAPSLHHPPSSSSSITRPLHSAGLRSTTFRFGGNHPPSSSSTYHPSTPSHSSHHHQQTPSFPPHPHQTSTSTSSPSFPPRRPSDTPPAQHPLTSTSNSNSSSSASSASNFFRANLRSGIRRLTSSSSSTRDARAASAAAAAAAAANGPPPPPTPAVPPISTGYAGSPAGTGGNGNGNGNGTPGSATAGAKSPRLQKILPLPLPLPSFIGAREQGFVMQGAVNAAGIREREREREGYGNGNGNGNGNTSARNGNGGAVPFSAEL